MRHSRLKVRELKSLVPFPLKVVWKLSSGESLRDAEKRVESFKHRWLVHNAVAIFRQWGWVVRRGAFGVDGIPAASDFVIYRETEFSFVECLASSYNAETFEKKATLNYFAPLWFVVPAEDYVREHCMVSDLRRWRAGKRFEHRPGLLVISIGDHPRANRNKFLSQFPTKESYEIGCFNKYAQFKWYREVPYV